MTKLKVAVAGLSHDHVWTELEHWREQPECRVVGAADERESLRSRAREEFNNLEVFRDWQTMLRQCKPDVLQICASNRDSAEIAVAAIEEGVHVALEKPLAADLSQATRILEAAKRNPAVRVGINWPDWGLPHFQIAPLLLEQGIIGVPHGGNVVMGHPGPEALGCSPAFLSWLTDPVENGGGALADYGCYGAAALSLLVGPVTSVSASAATIAHKHLSVEDNARLNLVHKNGLSQISASWTAVPRIREFTVFGSEGTVWLNRSGGFVQTLDSERLPLLPNRPGGEPLAPTSLPKEMVKWISGGHGLPKIYSLPVAWQAMAVIDAARQSAFQYGSAGVIVQRIRA